MLEWLKDKVKKGADAGERILPSLRVICCVLDISHISTSKP